MALGGGSFTSQNKVLPGSYINFVSAASASATLSDRGIVTMPFEMNWGEDSKVITLEKGDFIKNTMKILGYAYTDDKMADLRDVFLNANKLYLYRLNGGEKASNTFGTAKYSGTRGNDIKIVIQANVDDESKFDVKTYVDTVMVDSQTVAEARELVNNDFVVWKEGATLVATAGTAMTGGTNGEVTGDSHSKYLASMESYSFNCMGVKSTDAEVQKLYVAFTKRMRDDVGVKFQTVVYNQSGDYEGIINVKNTEKVIPWVVGAEGGCAVNASCTNKLYDGEADVETNYTQSQLEAAIKAGEFVLHQVGEDIRVLTDINSLTTTEENKGDIFKSNQSIRVMDQIANDIAVLFNTKYLGAIANNYAGRSALWLDIVKHHKDLQKLGAIEGFNDSDVVVEPGDTKKAVVVSDVVTIVNAMEQLYMTVTVQ